MRKQKNTRNNNRTLHYACYMGIILILPIFSMEVFGETIPEELTVQGNIQVAGDANVNGTISCDQLSANTIDRYTAPVIKLNNVSAYNNGGEIEIASGSTYSGSDVTVRTSDSSSGAAGDIHLHGGNGYYKGGSIHMSSGQPLSYMGHEGDIKLSARFVELNATKAIKFNGEVQVIALQGLYKTDFTISGGNGQNGPTLPPGKDLILKGGQGGTYGGGAYGPSGDVVIQTKLDMQGNTIENAHIEPCGGLSMGEFDAN